MFTHAHRRQSGHVAGGDHVTAGPGDGAAAGEASARAGARGGLFTTRAGQAGGVPPSGTYEGGRARQRRGAASIARSQCRGTVLWET